VPRDLISPGLFRFCALASILCKSPCAGKPLRFRLQVGCKRQIRTWFPHRQPQNLCLAVHFQIVGYLFAPVAITPHSHAERMVRFENFHASDIDVSKHCSCFFYQWSFRSFTTNFFLRWENSVVSFKPLKMRTVTSHAGSKMA
jgi:hypothetical protein